MYTYIYILKHIHTYIYQVHLTRITPVDSTLARPLLFWREAVGEDAGGGGRGRADSTPNEMPAVPKMEAVPPVCMCQKRPSTEEKETYKR
jgi:hypothetical protein